MSNINCILVTGSRRVGKDTFFHLLNKLYPNQFTRKAFADELKQDLNPLSQKMFQKNVDELDNKEKEIFRPIMISYGCAWREIDPLHWVKKVSYKIAVEKLQVYVCQVILDNRFPNEIAFFRDGYPDNTIVLEIEREGAPEPTDEEKKNIPLIKPFIDYSIKWPTVLPEKGLDELAPFVHDFYQKYFK